MIDWDAPDWGNHVTFAADGSWVADRHDAGAGSSSSSVVDADQDAVREPSNGRGRG
jgi:hypothetical protein